MSSKPHTCIWMDAGLVPYKLCPFEYDCDHCEFYMEITGKQKAEPKYAEERSIELCLRRPEEAYFSPGIQYYKNHMWLKRTGQNRLIIGPDEFMISLLPSVVNIVLAPIGKEIQSNGCLAWIQLPFCMLYLNTPVAGTVTEHNPRLMELVQNKEEFCEHSYSDFWMVKLATESAEIDRTQWLTKQEYTRLLSDDWQIVRSVAKENYNTPAGIASADGGELVDKIGIPYESYRDLIKKVCHGSHHIV